MCIYVNSVNNVTYVSSDHFLVDFLNLISKKNPCANVPQHILSPAYTVVLVMMCRSVSLAQNHGD